MAYLTILFGYGLLLGPWIVSCMIWNLAEESTPYGSSSSEIPSMNDIKNVNDGDPSTCFANKENNTDDLDFVSFILKDNYVYNIYGVALTTIRPGLPGHLKNFKIEIINTKDTSNIVQCSRENDTVPHSSHVLYVCEPNGFGNVINIQSMDSLNQGILTVCEVEILGRLVEFDLMCREKGYSFNETPTIETSVMASATGCALMCKQSGCHAYISQNQNGEYICKLYHGRKFFLNNNVNSSFYLAC